MLIQHINIDRTYKNTFKIKGDVAFSGSELASQFIFNILVSYSLTDSYRNIGFVDGSTLTGLFISYEDIYREYNANRKRYYRFQAVNKITTEVWYESPVAYLGSQTDGIHETIRYAETILNRHYIGTPCLLIGRMLNEKVRRCPICWDRETKQVTKAHCTSCYGTSFVGGYYPPISVQVAISATPVNNTPDVAGEDIYVSLQGRITNYPAIKPKDVIINTDNGKRYLIDRMVETTKLPQISTFERQWSDEEGIMSQIFTLVEFDSADVVYDIDPDTIVSESVSSDEFVINVDYVFSDMPMAYEFIISPV